MPLGSATYRPVPEKDLMATLRNKLKEVLPRTWSPNQVVAHNLTRARLLRGWTQDQAAEALAPYLGTRGCHSPASPPSNVPSPARG